MTDSVEDEFLLLNPGPVPVTPAVREAMSAPMVSHRSTAFESVYQRVQSGLDYVFEHSSIDGSRTASAGTPLVLNGTATMAMEAAIANLVDGDSEVVSLVNGKFGRRFARIGERHATSRRIEVEWGESFDLGAVERTVSADTDVVTMVHNETSTGILNPVNAVGDIVSANDALFVVDGVTSIGGDAFHIDEWDVDVAITDAQKALAAPPGISALYATPAALAAVDGESAPFYEDLDWYHRKAGDHQTPFTSAVPLFRAMAEAVEQIREEGMAARIQRHRSQSTAFRDAFVSMGLEPFPTISGESAYSNTVTAIELPSHLRKPDEFFDHVSARNVSISGGQAHLGGRIFRVSNMGNLTPEQIRRGVRTVGEAFQDVGVDLDVQAGLETVDATLD